jgi:hypothetical protein
MTPTDIRDVVNHVGMFGPAAVVRKMGRKWEVRFRAFGHPGLFSTKGEAERWAHDWYMALAQRQREAA